MIMDTEENCVEDKIPEKLGKYSVLEEIDRGKMGVVYLGYDPFIDRPVAVKMPLTSVLAQVESEEEYCRIFFNEAHTAGKLTHPNVVGIYDAGVDNDRCYIVMEYIEGGDTLKTYTTRDSLLPIETVVEMVFKCANALGYVHDQGVVHCDIKPNNILVTQDMEVKIGDFSISSLKGADEEESERMQSGTRGSPYYMSPEQMRGEIATPQSDLFSLGVVMYQMLTGQHLFKVKSLDDLIEKNLNLVPPSPQSIRAEIPDSLNRIVMKALEKDLDARYKTGLELASDLSLVFERVERDWTNTSPDERLALLKGMDFFEGFTDSEILEIVESSAWKEYQGGEDIIIEDDLDDCFYIIVKGKVDVLKKTTLVGSLEAGDCFGEMGYLSKTRRTATIQSNGYSTLLKIHSTVISQTSLPCQNRFLKIFLRTLIQRLADITEKFAC